MIIDITLVTVYDEGEVDKTGDNEVEEFSWVRLPRHFSQP